MPSHRFTIGQMVRLVTTKGLSPAAALTYTVAAPMPAYQNSPNTGSGMLNFNRDELPWNGNLKRCNPMKSDVLTVFAIQLAIVS